MRKINLVHISPWLLLGFFYIVSLTMLWPGIVSPDAAAQYQAAISGIYNDHHPPAMSLLWRYLDKIYPGPGLLFSFNLTLLYLSAGTFLYLFKDSKFKWWYAIFPVIPNMLAYTSLIVKDAGFAYSYLLSGAILSVIAINRDINLKLKYLLLIPILLLLFYGTAVKFQAKYLLFLFTLGIGYCYSNYKFSWQAVTKGIIIYIALIFSILSFNAKLVPNAQKSHSWQLVKLYDLTAMSLALNKPLYPDFVKNKPGFSFARVKQLFNPIEIDSLVFPVDSVLKVGQTETERNILWNTWFAAVKQYPLVYLKCRLRLWSFNLTTPPSNRSNPIDFLQKTALAPILTNPIISSVITYSFNIFKNSLCFIWLLPFLLLYGGYLGFSRLNKSSYALPLLIFSLTSIAMLSILFFFSMYATARYVFICTCLVHASHGFAYQVWRS